MWGPRWITYPARKGSHFPHIAAVFLPYLASQMTFAEFESSIPRNFLTNSESRKKKV